MSQLEARWFLAALSLLLLQEALGDREKTLSEVTSNESGQQSSSSFLPTVPIPTESKKAEAPQGRNSLRDLFRRRRKPLTKTNSKNSTASEILLDKIRDSGKQKKLSLSSSKEILLKNRRKLIKHSLAKQRFRPSLSKIERTTMSTTEAKDPTTKEVSVLQPTTEKDLANVFGIKDWSKRKYGKKKSSFLDKLRQRLRGGGEEEELSKSTTENPPNDNALLINIVEVENHSSQENEPPVAAESSVATSSSIEINLGASSEEDSDLINTTPASPSEMFTFASFPNFSTTTVMPATEQVGDEIVEAAEARLEVVYPTQTFTTILPEEELSEESIEEIVTKYVAPLASVTTPLTEVDDPREQSTKEEAEEEIDVVVAQDDVPVEESDPIDLSVERDVSVVKQNGERSPRANLALSNEIVQEGGDDGLSDLVKLIQESGVELKKTPKFKRKITAGVDEQQQVEQRQYNVNYEQEVLPVTPTLPPYPEDDDSIYQFTALPPSKKEVEEDIAEDAENEVHGVEDVPRQTLPGAEWESLDDDIIRSIEEILEVDIPVDSKLLYRDSSPRFTRDHLGQRDGGHEQAAKVKDGPKHPYAFSYTIFDENTGLTHSRDEEGDEDGVVKGSYQVLDADCTVRLVEYRADQARGFDVLNVERRPCDERQRQTLQGVTQSDKDAKSRKKKRKSLPNRVRLDSKQRNKVKKVKGAPRRVLADKSHQQPQHSGVFGARLNPFTTRNDVDNGFGVKIKSSPVSSSPDTNKPGSLLQSEGAPVSTTLTQDFNFHYHNANPAEHQEIAESSLPPASSHGPPNGPVSEYGAPQKESTFSETSHPVTVSHEPSSGAVSEYGAPQVEPIVLSESAHPSTLTHGLPNGPASEYGAPPEGTITDETSIPGTAPNAIYGVPVSPPIDELPPSGYAGPTYTTPVPDVQPPVHYGFPKGEIIDTQSSTDYGHPSDAIQPPASHYRITETEDSSNLPPPVTYGVPLGPVISDAKDLPEIINDQFQPSQPHPSQAPGFVASPSLANAGVPLQHDAAPPLVVYGAPRPNSDQHHHTIGQEAVLPPSTDYGVPLAPPVGPQAGYGSPSNDLTTAHAPHNGYNELHPSHGGVEQQSQSQVVHGVPLVEAVAVAIPNVDLASLSGFHSDDSQSSGSNHHTQLRPTRPPRSSFPGPTPPRPTVSVSTGSSAGSYDPFVFQDQFRSHGREKKTQNKGPNFVKFDDLGASLREIEEDVELLDTSDSRVLPNVVPSARLERRERRPKRLNQMRRNMLMNIILRPGGGDKSRALPRPRVDVKSEGSNVIIIRMTFPETENIQGLRAFAPEKPPELFDVLLPMESSVAETVTGRDVERRQGNPDIGFAEAKVSTQSKKHQRGSKSSNFEDELLPPGSTHEPAGFVTPKLEMFRQDEVVSPLRLPLPLPSPPPPVLPRHPPLALQPHLVNRPPHVPPPPHRPPRLPPPPRPPTPQESPFGLRLNRPKKHYRRRKAGSKRRRYPFI